MGGRDFRLARLLSPGYVDIIGLAVLYMGTFSLVLPFLCRDWVYSWYFEGDPSSSRMATRALDVNLARLTEAEAYFGQLDDYQAGVNWPSNHGGPAPRQEVELAIGIISVKRPVERRSGYNLGYLTQVSASVHRLIRQDTWFKIKAAFVCNVDAAPEEHEEVRRLARHLPVAVKYGSNGTKWLGEGQQAVFEKEKDDYGFCLHEALRYNPRYVVLLEDDAIPKDDLFKVIYRLLRNHITQPTSSSRLGDSSEVSGSRFGFLKLFYPPKWQGYANEPQRIAELLGLALLGGGLAIIMCHKRRLRYVNSRRWNSALVSGIFFVCGAMYLLLIAVSVGRQYVLELYAWSAYTYRLVPAPGCCTQAVLYPADIVPQLVDYFSKVQSDIDFSVDLVVDRFMSERHLEGFLVEPSVVRHVGMLSSLRHYDKRAAEFIF